MGGPTIEVTTFPEVTITDTATAALSDVADTVITTLNSYRALRSKAYAAKSNYNSIPTMPPEQSVK